jgi:hypothetical protein
VYGDTGSDGIQSVLEARGRRDAVTSFLAFDVLSVDGREVIAEPWTDRRKRLEDIGSGLDSKRIALVPVTDDAARLWALCVGQQGGEGIVLKDHRAPYRPGVRSPAWLKAKHRLTLRVQVLGGSPAWLSGATGAGRRACSWPTRTRVLALTTIEELVRVPNPDGWELRLGEADVLCWGVLPSGQLRHPVLCRSDHA